MKHSLILVTWLFAGSAGVVQAGTYSIGVEAYDYLPISKGEGGSYSGYARDVLDAFAAKYGHTFSYKPMPVARLIDEFAVQKTLDFKFPDNPYWAAEVKKGLSITYSKGVVSVTEGLMVLPGNKGKLTGVTKIATVRGFTPFPYLDQIKSKKISVNEVNNAEAAIRLGEAEKVEGVYLGVLAANYIMAETLKMPGALVLDPALPKSTNDFSLSTLAHSEVVKQLDEFLVKEKELVGKLKAKHKIVE